MFRGAILGAGNVALLGHVPGWRERRDVTIVAAADARPEAEGSVRGAIPGARFYTDAAELLERETLDFVDIASPPSSHAALAETAFARGLHVLCEKPLVLSAADLTALVQAARNANRALVTVHNWLFAEPLVKAKEIIASGVLGRVTRIRWSVTRTEPARVASGNGANWRLDPVVAGGGISIDHGWHALYAVRSLLPEAWTRVSARFEKRRFRDLPVEDTATLNLAGESASAEIFLTWAGDERRNTIEVEGEHGRLILDGAGVTVDARGSTRRSTLSTSLSDGSQHPDWFAGVADGFLREMTDESHRGANLREASLCVKTLEAARLSSETEGSWRPIA